MVVMMLMVVIMLMLMTLMMRMMTVLTRAAVGCYLWCYRKLDLGQPGGTDAARCSELFEPLASALSCGAAR